MAIVIAGKFMVLAIHTEKMKREQSLEKVFIIKVENEVKRDEKGKLMPSIVQTVQCLSQLGRIRKYQRTVHTINIESLGKEENVWRLFSYEPRRDTGEERKKKIEYDFSGPKGIVKGPYFKFYDDEESVYFDKKGDLRY